MTAYVCDQAPTGSAGQWFVPSSVNWCVWCGKLLSEHREATATPVERSNPLFAPSDQSR